MNEATIAVPIAGCTIGHWHDPDARTGCTVVLLPHATTGSGDIRGGSPATREFALLDPVHRVAQLDAIVLSGGSAFGLDAVQGVMRFCEANGRGFATAHGAVPIVVGMSLYDLGVGHSDIRPTAANGLRAANAASPTPTIGRVGAGCGATVGKWRSPSDGDVPTTDERLSQGGGLGIAVVDHDGTSVVAIVATNAWGDIDTTGTADRIADGTFDGWPTPAASAPAGTNTTIGAVVTNARLTKVECNLVAQSAHDGLARAVFPAHTGYDGDAFVAAATGEREASVDHVRMMATVATEQAIRMVGPATKA